MYEDPRDLIPTLPDLGIELTPLDADDPATAGDIGLLGRIGEGGMGRVYLGITTPAPLLRDLQ